MQKAGVDIDGQFQKCFHDTAKLGFCFHVITRHCWRKIFDLVAAAIGSSLSPQGDLLPSHWLFVR